MFYNNILILAILCQAFFCYTMDNTLAHSALKTMSDDLASAKVVFPLPIPKEVKKYFAPRIEKLKIPESSRALIVEMCNREKLLKTIENQKKENTKTIKNNIKISQEIFELQQQKNALEKALLIKKIEQKEQLQELNKKRLADAQQAKKIKLTIARQQPNLSTPITIKDYRFALKTLLYQHKSKEQCDLFDKLIDICEKNNDDMFKNNVIEGPYLNRKHHVLFGTINHGFRYIYYPCTRKISIHRTPFSELLTDISKFMDKEKTCPNACTYYKSKKLEFESISEDSSTDYSSHSSDMDISSDHELGLINIK